jgi:predicted nucleic acid-binding protein
MAEDVLSQSEAWRAYHRWFEDRRIGFRFEPESTELDRLFEQLSTGPLSSTKLWADAYLAAFATTAGLTLVTFDQAFRQIPSLDVTILEAQP